MTIYDSTARLLSGAAAVNIYNPISLGSGANDTLNFGGTAATNNLNLYGPVTAFDLGTITVNVDSPLVTGTLVLRIWER